MCELCDDLINNLEEETKLCEKCGDVCHIDCIKDSDEFVELNLNSVNFVLQKWFCKNCLNV